ncbi:DNA-binding protein [Streptomyces sp. NPDC003038]|uniref:helix-turn-helix transcriptional regulator n=1 Tax=unclassified Streptomyces TaxID=2593676 RepID=UPI0033B7C043
MIPHGRPALTLDDVAARAGVSVSSWRRHHHAAFTAAVKPLPGSARPLLYDAAQTDAHLAGLPVPPLPQEPHGQDLLSDSEVAAVTGLTTTTIHSDVTAGRLPPGVELHGRWWWTREAAEARAVRPAQYKGRTPGAKGRAPRRTPPDARVPEIAAALAAAHTGDGPAVTPASLATHYGISTRTAERLIHKARTPTRP